MSASAQGVITHVFAGLAVRDFAAARPWYERLFGRAPDMLPMAHETVWRLSQGGLVYIVEDPSRAGHGLLTMAVVDLSEYLAGLAARGLGTESTEDRARTVRDPDGNAIKFFEDPGSGQT